MLNIRDKDMIKKPDHEKPWKHDENSTDDLARIEWKHRLNAHRRWSGEVETNAETAD